MIYPAIDNIRVLQNSTWKKQYRATHSVRSVQIDVDLDSFASPCHKLLANDAVCIAPANDASVLPCGLDVTQTYYVLSNGLTSSTFKISASIGGDPISISSAPVGTFTVSKPIDLTAYVIDSDIKTLDGFSMVATMTATIADPISGNFVLSLQPFTTLSLSAGQYAYDVSLTNPSGERYYWISGTVTIVPTYSRN